MKNSIISWLLIATGIMVSLASNPNREEHQLKLKKSNPLAANFAGKTFRSTLKFHSYYFLSVLTDDNQPITIGALGSIWVNNERIDIR